MGVVIKRADELKPGDMLAGNGMAGRVVQWVGKPAGNSVEVRSMGADSVIAPSFVGAASGMLVAIPDLTPAQQHADALLALVESLPVTDKITALLDKIRPPVAPTMDEVLTTLVGLSDPKVTAAESSQRIKALVDKAKRAGWGK